MGGTYNSRTKWVVLKSRNNRKLFSSVEDSFKCFKWHYLKIQQNPTKLPFFYLDESTSPPKEVFPLYWQENPRPSPRSPSFEKLSPSNQKTVQFLTYIPYILKGKDLLSTDLNKVQVWLGKMSQFNPRSFLNTRKGTLEKKGEVGINTPLTEVDGTVITVAEVKATEDKGQQYSEGFQNNPTSQGASSGETAPLRRKKRDLGKAPMERAPKKKKPTPTIQTGGQFIIREPNPNRVVLSDDDSSSDEESTPLGAETSSPPPTEAIPLQAVRSSTPKKKGQKKDNTAYKVLMGSIKKSLQQGISTEAPLEKSFLKLTKCLSEAYQDFLKIAPAASIQLKEQIKQLEADKDKLEIEKAEEASKVSEMSRQRDEAQNTLSEVLKQNSSNTQKLEEYEQELNRLKEENSRLSQERRQATTDNLKLQLNLSSLRSFCSRQSGSMLQLKRLLGKLSRAYESHTSSYLQAHHSLAQEYKVVACNIETTMDFSYDMALQHVQVLYPNFDLDLSRLNYTTDVQEGQLVFGEKPDNAPNPEAFSLPLECRIQVETLPLEEKEEITAALQHAEELDKEFKELNSTPSSTTDSSIVPSSVTTVTVNSPPYNASIEKETPHTPGKHILSIKEIEALLITPATVNNLAYVQEPYHNINSKPPSGLVEIDVGSSSSQKFSNILKDLNAILYPSSEM